MKISNIKEKILSNTWKPLKQFTYQYTRTDGHTEEQTREVYDKGDGAAVLMYNKQTKKILLVQQFRMAAYVNGISSGIVTEVPAGMLDKDSPEVCVLKEIEEETGYKIPKVKSIGSAIMTPGAVTEVTHFFVAPYDESMKVSKGGGVAYEQEDIVILEIGFNEIKRRLKNNDFKDAKTLILLQYAYIHHLLDT